MARRGKRGADIDMQADRLVNIADDSGNYDRMDRINSIRARYKSNIAHSLGTHTLSEKGLFTRVNRSTYMGIKAHGAVAG
jgi:hypothetical protein